MNSSRMHSNCTGQPTSRQVSSRWPGLKRVGTSQFISAEFYWFPGIVLRRHSNWLRRSHCYPRFNRRRGFFLQSSKSTPHHGGIVAFVAIIRHYATKTTFREVILDPLFAVTTSQECLRYGVIERFVVEKIRPTKTAAVVYSVDLCMPIPQNFRSTVGSRFEPFKCPLWAYRNKGCAPESFS